MTAIDPSTRLAELVVAVPRRAALLERLRIDYCCGGDRTLAEACAQRGLDAATVAALIEALDGAPRGPEPHDVAGASIVDLCDHIVQAHHDVLRRELPMIEKRLATVVRVHGGQRPELRDLQRIFTGMRAALEQHMEIEESTLFPACRAAELPDGPDVDEALLAQHEREHAGVGEGLVAMRELAGGYDVGRALCSTHRALLAALHELELDLHQHVHEENNILFARVRALAGA